MKLEKKKHRKRQSMLTNLDPVTQAFLASLFTWGVTALGAAVVFVSPSSNRAFLDCSLGFSSGVMLAASFWSLLVPAIEISEHQMGKLAFVPVGFGFALGALFVHLSDRVTQRYNSSDQFIPLSDEMSRNNYDDGGSSTALRQRFKKSPNLNGVAASEVAIGVGAEQKHSHQKVSWHRIWLLIIAITAHNFPEGLAVGVAFGGAGKSASVSLEKASNLALSIGLQNFPEGMAVALPLAAFGHPKWKAFLYGQMSGMVEPMAALIGASLVLTMEMLLPYALSFAAGAMIFVVFDSIIPEANSHGNGKLCSLFSVIGFLNYFGNISQQQP
uniref:Zinc transporter ZIP11 n=1 Tax=Globodera rostochiensis TaxID=31243 RepID=A0A914IDU0_GLORO